MRRAVRELVIEGVSLQAPRPLGSVTLRFTPGVDVLYGLNGAGKSRILQSLLNTIGAGDGSAGGAVHLRLKGVLAEEEDFLAAWQSPDWPEWGGQLPFWQVDLFTQAVNTVSRLRLPDWCPWERDLHVDWFSYLMASAAWSRLVHFEGLDAELGARVISATVSQGRFALRLDGNRHWDVLACARSDDASGADRLLLARLEAALADPGSGGDQNPEGLSLLDQVRNHLEAVESDPGSIDDPESEILSLRDQVWNWRAEFGPRALLNHPWAAVPLFSTGVQLESDADWRRLLPVVSETSSAVDLNRQSSDALLESVEQEHLSELVRSILENKSSDHRVAMDDVHAVESQGRPWLNDVSSAANRMFSNLLTDAPPLKLEVRPPHDWYQGEPPLRWWVEDPTGVAVELRDLSTAQKRWSTLAIQLAISALEDDPERVCAKHRLLVLDEPETALHASAQRFLAQGIGQIAPDLQVIVASHSPAFLDHTDFRLHHVHRGQGGTTALTQLLGDQLDTVRSLGMAPSDLFQHIRVFVVVEGRHDEVILRSCIGEELRAVGAVILAMSGAAKLAPVVDSRLIFDYSDAKVLAVIDNTDKRVLAIWDRAVEAAHSDSPSAARSILEELKRDGEPGFIRNFGIRSVELGRTDRIDLCGLNKPDILEYLPPKSLMPRASDLDWDQLRSRAGAKSGTAIRKTWLRDNYGFSGEDSALENAASQLDELPDDFVGVIDRATRMAREPFLGLPRSLGF